MADLFLRVVASPQAEVGTVPLPLEEGGSCSVYLRCLPGASGIHLAFSDGQDRILQRVEVKAAGGETVEVRTSLGEDLGLRVLSHGRRVLTLPPGSRYEPPPPIPPSAPDASLDLVFVIDGTARSFTTQDNRVVSEPLLGREPWLEHVERLSRFAEALSRGSTGSRFGVLAFGDEAFFDTEARDLQTFYVLHPPEEEQRRFEPLEPSRLQDVLLALEPTSGVDFVDALAEALRACRRLSWRRERARRVVLICGDSPGHSILHPLRQGADAQARRLDVDVEAEALHRDGIEVVTLYLDPPANLGLRQVAFQRELFDGAREQYTRLASLPAMAFELSRFEPDRAAEAVRVRQGALGRGAALGELIGITVP